MNDFTKVDFYKLMSTIKLCTTVENCVLENKLLFKILMLKILICVYRYQHFKCVGTVRSNCLIKCQNFERSQS